MTSPVLTFTFLDAGHGDACVITWADANRSGAMLVDGGPTATYDQRIRPYLAAHDTKIIDVTCVTHLDDDHIGGVIRLLTDADRARTAHEPEEIQVDRLWFNDIEDLVDSIEPGLAASAPSDDGDDAVLAASYRQGRDLARLSARLGLAGNPPFYGVIRQGAATSVHGLDVTVVTPNQEALSRLAERWRRALPQPADGSGDVTAAALKDPGKDYSVPNLSSITLYLRYGDRTALLTGDARGDHILAGLTAAGICEPHRPTHIGVLKLPHHGSAKNVTPSFFQHVTADHYVISTDGHKHDHPGGQTLRWLVESRNADDVYTIHLTNPVTAALSTLGELKQGRAFSIDVRADAAIGITIST